MAPQNCNVLVLGLCDNRAFRAEVTTKTQTQNRKLASRASSDRTDAFLILLNSRSHRWTEVTTSKFKSGLCEKLTELSRVLPEI